MYMGYETLPLIFLGMFLNIILGFYFTFLIFYGLHIGFSKGKIKCSKKIIKLNKIMILFSVVSFLISLDNNLFLIIDIIGILILMIVYIVTKENKCKQQRLN